MVLSTFDQENHDRILKEEYMKQGIEIGQQQTKRIFKLHMEGKSEDEIAGECGVSPDEVRKILE